MVGLSVSMAKYLKLSPKSMNIQYDIFDMKHHIFLIFDESYSSVGILKWLFYEQNLDFSFSQFCQI